MQHCDPDDLALLALGEGVSVDGEHLATCRRCSEELEELRTVVAAARAGEVTEVVPPASVWAGIAAATGVRAVPAGVEPPSQPVASPAPVLVPDVPRAPGRRWSTWALAAAAVGGLLVGGGAASLVGGGIDDAGQQPVAAADLEPLVEGAGVGQAGLLESERGTVLRLTAASLPPGEDGFYEVWLLDESARRMVPLGVLVGGEGEFVVPAGLDVGDYPVVDVSVEPLDGDPTHSGNSLLRGSLGS
ncbi:MAG: anti-sigma factor domain-containing protein [Actinomycetes bacterium]